MIGTTRDFKKGSFVDSNYPKINEKGI